MSASALLLVVLFAAPPLSESPAVEAWASEDWPADALLALSKLPRTMLAVQTRSNMLRPSVFSLLARGSSAVSIAAPLAEAHVDQLRKLTRAVLVLKVPNKPDAALKKSLMHLGPQLVRFQVARLDAATAAWLADFKRCEVELDLRGRLPEQEELERLAQLARASRILRIAATDPPALIAALRAVGPARVIVESLEDRVPEAMVEALHASGLSVRVRLDSRASVDDVLRLAALAQLSLELVLEADSDQALKGATQLLSGLAAAVP